MIIALVPANYNPIISGANNGDTVVSRAPSDAESHHLHEALSQEINDLHEAFSPEINNLHEGLSPEIIVVPRIWTRQ